MTTLVLKREKETKYGTFGVIKHLDLVLYTLELPWNNNAKETSCIPEGTYEFKPHNSVKFPGSYILSPTEPREAILIHVGNTIIDTHGCILVGLSRTNTGILNSKKALKLLNDLFPKGGELLIERD